MFTETASHFSILQVIQLKTLCLIKNNTAAAEAVQNVFLKWKMILALYSMSNQIRPARLKRTSKRAQNMIRMMIPLKINSTIRELVL